jgi:TPR repeat protein
VNRGKIARLVAVDGEAVTPTPPTEAAIAVAEPRRRGRVRMAVEFFAGGLAALAIAALVLRLELVPEDWLFDPARRPDVALANARAHGTLKGILAVGPTSPRGRTARGVDSAVALELADRHLAGVALPRDQGEAAFWLRHALSLPLHTDQMLWALTQLGAIHAAPDGFEPDYGKARLLWELASTYGDPVAMCFQATLYEYGLGVRQHKALARAWYERARFNGGCPSLEAGLERTR